MDLSVLTRLNEIRSRREAAILVTDLENGQQRLIERSTDLANDPLLDEVGKRLLSGKSGLVETETGKHFLTVSVPAPRLVLIGAVHITQALVPMARISGFDVTVIDPRTAFATEERFPDTDLQAEWPEDTLKGAPLDAYTALAAVTHDPKIDDFPLQDALRAGCFYVGALGSRKTHAKRRERFIAAGITEADFNRIDAPIGLDIGAASPQEIAVAVLGSVIRALRKPETV